MTRSRRRPVAGSQETREIPFSLESSVPYEDAIFHLGVHNLPASQAHTIVADLAAYTQHPSSPRLTELLGGDC
jgi:hypothetical protein